MPKNTGTKMESGCGMDWKERAKKMYFDGGPINAISEATGKSRQAVSGYLKTLPGFAEEKERRKRKNRENRKEYKRLKNREYRGAAEVTAQTLKREHDIAARILSHEKY